MIFIFGAICNYRWKRVIKRQVIVALSHDTQTLYNSLMLECICLVVATCVTELTQALLEHEEKMDQMTKSMSQADEKLEASQTEHVRTLHSKDQELKKLHEHIEELTAGEG